MSCPSRKYTCKNGGGYLRRTRRSRSWPARPTAIASSEELEYTGKDYDPDTGLYYFNARWYDATTGRFTTEDPIRDGWNWYQYARSNPLRFVDPTGLAVYSGDDYDYDNWIDPLYGDEESARALQEMQIEAGMMEPIAAEVHQPSGASAQEVRTAETPGYSVLVDLDGDGDPDEATRAVGARASTVSGAGEAYASAEASAGAVEQSWGANDRVVTSVEAMVANATIGIKDVGVEAEAFTAVNRWTGVINFEVLGLPVRVGGELSVGSIGAGIDSGLIDTVIGVRIGAGVGAGVRVGIGKVDVDE